MAPATADQASVTWSLHKAVGDTLEYVDERGRPFQVRIVAGVESSILQGNLLIVHGTGETNTHIQITEGLVDRLIERLFGRHILQGSDNASKPGTEGIVGQSKPNGFGDAKVNHFWNRFLVVVSDQDIRWFDIAVDNVLLVSVVQRRTQLSQNCRHLLERHGLATAMLEEINTLLGERGLILRQGTMVDATLVAAPTSAASVRIFFMRSSGAKGLPFWPAAWGEAPGPNLTALEIEGDHAFATSRIALQRTVIDWMMTQCLQDQP